MATYSAAAKVAAHTAFRDLMDAETGTAKIRIRDNSNVLLAEIILSDPSGSVDAGTGQLTFSIATQETDAPATGTADTAQFVDADDAVHLTLPCTQGTAAVSGECVLNSLDIIIGGDVSVLSAVVG